MDPFDLRLWPNFKKAGGNINEPAWVDQIVIDSRRINSKNSLFVALKGERVDGFDYIGQAYQNGLKYVLVSESKQLPENLENLQFLRVPDPLRAFQEIAKTYRLNLSTKIIGITGSFGKTMVKDLLHSFLSTEKKVAASPESFNSQIGVPLSLLTLRQDHEYGIIEAAISKKEEMEFLADMIHPNFTILAPIGKKHLNTLENLSSLTQEMMKFIGSTPKDGWTLAPNAIIENFKSILNCHYFSWDLLDPRLPHSAVVNNDLVLPAPYQIKFPNAFVYSGLIKNGYSYFNNLINMALKAAWLLDVSPENIQEILDDFQPEPMRTEIWKSQIGATFINDTYCSDPQSIDLALKHFNTTTPDQKKVFFFGGMKGDSKHHEIDYKRIGKALNKAGTDKIILFGNKQFTPLLEEFEHTPNIPEITICSTRQEALDFLKESLHPNDFVIMKGENKISLDILTEMFNDSINNNQCFINFAAIQDNINALKKKLGPSVRPMIIVKALAYGTDDIRMAKFLSSCHIDILGVSYVDEGVALKRAGVKQAIFSINAAIYEAAKVAKWDLEVGVSDLNLIQALAEEGKKQNKKLKVHLHVNTGMGRFGCSPEKTLDLAREIKNSPFLELEGIMTHFACAEDENEDNFTYAQAAIFDQVIAQLKKEEIDPKWKHAANSSAAIRFNFPQYNMARIGLAAYGLYPSEATRKSLDLRLALSLTSRIVGINICKKGETVSYGRSYKIERDVQKIAVLPIGYFDGLHRNYSGKAYVYIRGMKAPMVGKICMDYMMVDVTDISNVEVGDRVLIFGEDEFGQYLSPEDLATSGNSIIHELITCLGPRIQRVFIYEEGHQIR